MKSAQPRHVRDALSCMCAVNRPARWLIPTLAVMCLIVIAPAHAAQTTEPAARNAVATEKAGDAEKPAIPLNTNPAGEAIVRKILERAAPSDANNIRVLGPLAGEWNCMISFWVEPGVGPQQSTATVTNEMILDGRFLSTNVLGSLNVGGHLMPWKGQGLIGYDNVKNSFTSTWVDTMTTGMMTGSGAYDDKNRVIKEAGRFTNPLTGSEEGFHSELKFADGSNYKLTVFALDKAGKQSKLMEIDYSRKGQ